MFNMELVNYFLHSNSGPMGICKVDSTLQDVKHTQQAIVVSLHFQSCFQSFQCRITTCDVTINSKTGVDLKAF